MECFSYGPRSSVAAYRPEPRGEEWEGCGQANDAAFRSAVFVVLLFAGAILVV